MLLAPRAFEPAVVDDFFFFLNHIPSGSEINLSSLGHES